MGGRAVSVATAAETKAEGKDGTRKRFTWRASDGTVFVVPSCDPVLRCDRQGAPKEG